MESYLKRAAMAATDTEREAILLEGANFFSAKLSEATRCNRMDVVLMYAVLKQYEETTRKQMKPFEAVMANELSASMGAVTICL